MSHADLIALWTGRATLAAMLAVGIFIVGFVVVVLFMRFWPRFHIGKPQHTIKLITTDNRTINGKPSSRLVQTLRLTSWFGLSERRAGWFFGLIFWVRDDD